MFKAYSILESYLDRVKIRHNKTGDISWRYKSTCHLCGRDRGWKKRYLANTLCVACAQHMNFLSKLDRSQYPHVDFDDKMDYIKPKGGSEKRYRASCKKCGKDRGYITLSSIKKLCRSCTRADIHRTKTAEEKILIAKKFSMTQTGDLEFEGFHRSELDKQRSIYKTKGLSKECLERDRYTCNNCSAVGIELYAHHLNSFDHCPDERFNLDNLVSLCSSCRSLFHARYGKGKNTKSQYEEFKSNFATKDVVILTGAPASGKSWILGQIQNFNTIDSDLICKKDIAKKVNDSDRPLLALTVGISTFIKNNPTLNCRLVVIDEDETTIKQRMLSRGGKITNTIARRIRRMKQLAKKAIFAGTAQECLDFLRQY